MTTDYQETPAQRLTRYIDEGRLIRGRWHDGPRGPDGYERACVRVAMYPDADDSGGTAACPAEDMPQWLAHLIPWIDDAGTRQQWEPLMRRFAAVAHRWPALDAAGWRRALLGTLAAIVTEARTHTDDDASRAACDTVIGLCEDGAAPDDSRWTEAAKAAEAAAVVAWTAAARAAEAAAKAAEAAAVVAWTEAADAAARAARAATDAARAATAKAAAKAAAGGAADRIIAGIITAIDAACDAAEADLAKLETT